MTDHPNRSADIVEATEVREAIARMLVPFWYGGFERQERNEHGHWEYPPGTPNIRAYDAADKALALVAARYKAESGTAVARIAKFSTSTEMQASVDAECGKYPEAAQWHASADLADFRSHYDECIQIARAAASDVARAADPDAGAWNALIEAKERAEAEVEQLRAVAQSVGMRAVTIEECARVAENYPSFGLATEHPVEYWIRALASQPSPAATVEAATSSDGGGESRPASTEPQASALRRPQGLIGEAGVAPSPSDSHPSSSAASVSPLIWNALEQALDRLEWLEAYKAGKRNMLPPADAVIPLLKAAQKAALTLAAPQAVPVTHAMVPSWDEEAALQKIAFRDIKIQNLEKALTEVANRTYSSDRRCRLKYDAVAAIYDIASAALRGEGMRPSALTRPAPRTASDSDYIEKLKTDIAFCREAMRHADIDLSMVLPLVNADMQKEIRKTLARIDEAKIRSLSLSCPAPQAASNREVGK